MLPKNNILLKLHSYFQVLQKQKWKFRIEFVALDYWNWKSLLWKYCGKVCAEIRKVKVFALKSFSENMQKIKKWKMEKKPKSVCGYVAWQSNSKHRSHNSCLAQWLVPIFLKRKIESRKTFLYLHQHVQLVATDAKQRNVSKQFKKPLKNWSK